MPRFRRRQTGQAGAHPSPPDTSPTCNICGSTGFSDFSDRPISQCDRCSSLERHRVCFEVYSNEGLLTSTSNERRVLQFAPERITHDLLSTVDGTTYMCADVAPERYPHAQPLRISLPDDLSVFPDQYFDYLIHNHVWEHIPGRWIDHVAPFRRILKVGGKMIFTFPFSPVSAPEVTLEGGEQLESDEERLRVFGQHDHVRVFGLDFIEHLTSLDGIEFNDDGISDQRKREIRGGIRNWFETVFIIERTEPGVDQPSP